MKVSAQAMYLYSQPTQACNPICRGPPLSYPSVFNCEKDSCSQRPHLFPSPRIYVFKALTLTQPLIPDPAHTETYSIHIQREILLNHVDTKYLIVKNTNWHLKYTIPTDIQFFFFNFHRICHKCPTHYVINAQPIKP